VVRTECSIHKSINPLLGSAAHTVRGPSISLTCH